MDEHEGLTGHLVEEFEARRPHLRGVAYRILGSLSEAEDAVQEAWLRLSRAETSEIQNLHGWLTTVVARVCLDMLRTRRSRREESLDPQALDSPGPIATRGGGLGAATSGGGIDPEQEALLADSVGLAMLVVLDALVPAERLAFVLHDMFAVPFEEVATILGKSPMAARQLASRARRRVQGKTTAPAADFARQRTVVDAYLAAARGGDFEGLLTLLDPDVRLRSDRSVLPAGEPGEIRGAENVAAQVLRYRARLARPVVLNGSVGLIVAPGGHLLLAISFTLTEGRISRVDVIGDPARLRQVSIALLDD
jgi:RNA polymerase sigma-70 factor (ECF subfamily)